MSSQDGAGRREVAWRIFAAEYNDATLEHSDSDEERAPNYVVTPTGARINRLFVVGVLTEIEQVGDEVLRARVVDPTGGFVVYAGQYQPDALAFLERASPPTFVAVTGKARTFQPEDSDLVYTSIRPESINTVDAETRDRWSVQTAEQTLARVRTFARALDSDERGESLQRTLEANGVDTGLATGIPLALDHYHTTTPYLAGLQDVALDAARVVAGQQDEVGSLDTAPDEPGEATIDFDASLDTAGVAPETDSEPASVSEPESADESPSASEPASSESESVDESESVAESEPADSEPNVAVTSEPETSPESDSEPVSEPDTGSDSVAEADSEAEPAPEAESAPDSGPETTTPPAEAREPELGGEPDEQETGESGADDELDDFDSVTTEDTSDELGDFGADEPESADELDDFDSQPTGEDVSGEMYEFEDGERERIEEEFGTEFSTGSEVESAGEADIETPEPEDESEPEEETAAEPAETTGPDAGTGQPAQTEATEPEAEPDEIEDTESETDADSTESASAKEAPENLENAVMETMQELNGGDGVERDRLLAGVADSYDVTPEEVDEALQDALMAGRCYESGEDTLKPI